MYSASSRLQTREIPSRRPSGYVLKDTPADMLVNVLRRHGGGKSVIREALRAPTRPGLTPREREINKLLAEDHTVRKIAGRLRISM